MTYLDFLMDAIETVLTWDLPDEVFPDAVTEVARLMAGVTPDEILDHSHIH